VDFGGGAEGDAGEDDGWSSRAAWTRGRRSFWRGAKRNRGILPSFMGFACGADVAGSARLLLVGSYEGYGGAVDGVVADCEAALDTSIGVGDADDLGIEISLTQYLVIDVLARGE